MAKRKRKKKEEWYNSYAVLGDMVLEAQSNQDDPMAALEVAQRTKERGYFQGLIACSVCGKLHMCKEGEESGWRLFEVDDSPVYFCADDGPPDHAGREAYQMFYQSALPYVMALKENDLLAIEKLSELFEVMPWRMKPSPDGDGYDATPRQHAILMAAYERSKGR